MIKRLTAVFCLLAVMFSAGGCRLAKEDGAGTAAEQDRLIGVFVTTAHLDLFDFEGYMKDNPARITEGGEINLDGDSQKYNGRVYAAQTITDGHTDYTFEGLSGVRFFEPYVPATASMNAYYVLIGGDGIGDAKVANAAGDKESLTLEGTIYVTPEAAGRTYFLNPVYQDAQGAVYVTTGSGSTNSYKHDEGMVFSQSYKESYKKTENGKETTDDVSVTVTISLKYNAEKLVILQLDADHTILARDEYTPNAVPDSLTPHTGTAYIIAESSAPDPDGKTQVTRALFDRDDEYIRSYHDRGDGILLPRETKIEWP